VIARAATELNVEINEAALRQAAEEVGVRLAAGHGRAIDRSESRSTLA
jgi:hypothetical protein